MLLQLVIILLIVIVMCTSISFNDRYKCPKFAVRMKYVRASRLPDLDSSNQIGKDMIILKLDRDVPCGIYSLNTVYGIATIIVSNTNSRLGYMIMENSKSIAHINLFDLWDLQRIESDTNLFIQTYNRGCCN
jgi:hypothetical protein